MNAMEVDVRARQNALLRGQRARVTARGGLPHRTSSSWGSTLTTTGQDSAVLSLVARRSPPSSRILARIAMHEAARSRGIKLGSSVTREALRRLGSNTEQARVAGSPAGMVCMLGRAVASLACTPTLADSGGISSRHSWQFENVGMSARHGRHVRSVGRCAGRLADTQRRSAPKLV